MRWLLIAVMGLMMGFGAAVAQTAPDQLVQSPILTIDTERLYQDSDFGQAVAAEFDAKGNELAAENRRIEEELTQEERSLTERRSEMEPAAFRVLADAFDAKVQDTRRAQDAKTRALNQELEERRVQFLQAAAPVLEELMRRAGAAVILERRSVFLSANAIDVTGAAIERLNEVLGDEAGSDN